MEEIEIGSITASYDDAIKFASNYLEYVTKRIAEDHSNASGLGLVVAIIGDMKEISDMVTSVTSVLAFVYAKTEEQVAHDINMIRGAK